MCNRSPPTRIGHILALSLCIGAMWLGSAAAAGAPITIPKTPAGNMLTAWLRAFDSGNRARIESFDEAHIPWWNLDRALRARARTGGYEIRSILGSGRFWVAFRAREVRTSAQIRGSLVVRSYEPGHITLLSLMAAGGGSTALHLNQQERARVIGGAARLLKEFYLYPAVAGRVSKELEARLAQGAYRGITDGGIFAIRLSDDLVALTGDKHVQIDFFAKPPRRKLRGKPRLQARRGAGGNCGIERTDRLAHNVGYLKLEAFGPPRYCARAAIAAMNSLADSDALIIDLRDNHGGAPRMAALIASFLFDKRTHLDDIYTPSTHSTEQLWTLRHVPGRKFIAKPVFVLTSGSTFSTAEEFAYDLKSLKRAIVVGETTGGGAHLEAPHRIDDHFFIRVPFARFVNPITGTDWEGTGVQPDVRVSAAQALDVAERLAACYPPARLRCGSSGFIAPRHPRPRNVVSTAASSGVCGSLPRTASRRELSMCSGTRHR